MKKRPKKTSQFFGFVFFGQPKNRLQKSVFGREKPTKNDRKKRLSVFGSRNPASAYLWKYVVSRYCTGATAVMHRGGSK